MAHATSRHGSYDERCDLKLLEDGRWEATVLIHWDDSLNEAVALLIETGFDINDLVAIGNVALPTTYQPAFKHTTKFEVTGTTEVMQRMLQVQYDDHELVLKA